MNSSGMESKMYIPKVLASIKTTDNIKMQIKMLTGLSAILPFKELRDEIVTSSDIYNTAHSILNRGVGDSSMRVLGFLTGLMRAARPPAPASLARALIRRSGCLQDMANMFLGSMMMYEDTWKTLCECLVESCKNCEENQNYCSRLISTCIQRCDMRNSEILKLLHTLLLNHISNVHLFVECNGLSIFTRESIRDCSRMELLSIVVENPAAADILKHDTDLLESLITLGESWQGSLTVVDRASIILFHIASRIEGNEKIDNSVQRALKKMYSESAIETTSQSSANFSVSFLQKQNWDKTKTTNVFNNINTGNKSSTNATNKSGCIAQSDGQKRRLIRSGINNSKTEYNFKPNFVSTPKRKFQTANGRKISKSHEVNTGIAIQKGINTFRRQSHWNNSAPTIKQKLSMSTRLFKIVKNSWASVYQTMENILFQSLPYTALQNDTSKPDSNFNEGTSRSRSTRYTKQQVFQSVAAENDTTGLSSLQRKLSINHKCRNNIIKKLKTGIHFYGCNFKKISRTMWPQEKQITARALYSIYRKYIVK